MRIVEHKITVKSSSLKELTLGWPFLLGLLDGLEGRGWGSFVEVHICWYIYIGKL